MTYPNPSLPDSMTAEEADEEARFIGALLALMTGFKEAPEGYGTILTVGDTLLGYTSVYLDCNDQSMTSWNDAVASGFAPDQIRQEFVSLEVLDERVEQDGAELPSVIRARIEAGTQPLSAPGTHMRIDARHH